MKKSILLILVAVVASFGNEVSAQKAKILKLEQAPGVFTKTELSLQADKPYIFEVTNKGVDHEVGFVIAPKGKEADQSSFITSSFLSETIKDGESASSKEVTLAKGEYVYFCPMNPTPLYTITVE